ncbi:MAG TPA: DUF2953 domain-containing protein [Methanospirillum sp.]|nr:DUF2953 domain-containing protein [Methanospirillum sp.]
METLISSLLILSCLIFVSGTAVFIYLIPLRLSVELAREEGKADFRAGIGWGLIRVWIIPSSTGWEMEVRIGEHPLIRRPVNEKETEGEPATSIPSPSKPCNQDIYRYIPVIRRLIPELYHHTVIEKITGTMRFGAGDPVTTGMVYGYYQAVLPFISGSFCSVNLIPVFDRGLLDGRIHAGIRIICPLGLVIRTVGIILPVVIPDSFLSVIWRKSGAGS